MPAAFSVVLSKIPHSSLESFALCLKSRTPVFGARPLSVEVDQLCVVVINVLQLFLREDVGLLKIIR